MRIARIPVALCLLLGTTASLSAQPIIDGLLQGAEGYQTLFIQNNRTGFGDCTNPAPDICPGGSEIDGIYGTISGDRLYMMVTGNLENNFNKLELFFDGIAGGQNRIDDTDPLPEIDGFVDGDGENGVGALQRMENLQFDTGFLADHLLVFTNGPEDSDGDPDAAPPVPPVQDVWIFTAHFGEVKPISAGGQGHSLGGNPSAQVVGGTLIDRTTANPQGDPAEQFFIQRDTLNDIGLRATIDNSNVDGVLGGNVLLTEEEMDAAAAVDTGIEFSLPLAAIGNPSGDIKISAFVNGVGHDFLSNQVSGGFQFDTGNLAGPGTVNFANIPGDQFVTLANPGRLRCDLNGDRSVDAADAGTLFANWASADPTSDINDDGVVDAADAGICFSEWTGDAGPAGAMVPEPAHFWLLALVFARLSRLRSAH